MTGPILTTVKNYAEMLNKISIYTFFASVIAITLLRSQSSAFDSWFNLVSQELLPQGADELTIGGVSIVGGTGLAALIIAFIFRALKFHDRLSDVFRIRQRFDVDSILLPMALASGTTLSVEKIEKVLNERKTLMPKVFYKYASSTDPQIDKHLITMALDQWSWYWVLAEISAIAVATSLLLSLFGSMNAAFWTLFSVLIFLCLMWGIKIYCARYALREVNEILSDEKRLAEVAEVFDAL